MKKAECLKWGVALLFLSAVVQAATGAAILFDLSSARPRLAGSAVEIHEWNAPLLATLIVIHVWMNREWLKSQFSRRASAPSAEAQRR